MQRGGRRGRSLGNPNSSRTIAPASAPTGSSSWCGASRPSSRRATDYWGGKPAIDTVVFKEVPTSGARVQLLRGGAVDIAQYLQPLEIIDLQKAPNMAVETVPASFMIWIELNAKIPPFDNVDVRRAMNFAFPQQQIIQAVFQRSREPAQRLHAQHLSGLRGALFPYSTIWPGPGSCWNRPAGGPASRPRSPTMRATRCRSQSPSYISPRCARSASSCSCARCRPARSTISSPSASSR